RLRRSGLPPRARQAAGPEGRGGARMTTVGVLLGAHSIYWDLPVLIVVVSLVYSATRFDRWDYILREAFRWGLRMALFLIGIVLILSGLALDDRGMTLRW